MGQSRRTAASSEVSRSRSTYRGSLGRQTGQLDPSREIGVDSTAHIRHNLASFLVGSYGASADRIADALGQNKFVLKEDTK